MLCELSIFGSSEVVDVHGATFLKSRICRRDWLISRIQEPKFKVYSIFLWETNLEFLKKLAMIFMII